MCEDKWQCNVRLEMAY